ncbi:MAG: type II toxin-antitoxin system prevent-host-death family antitoxin [Nevskia sp.]|nr:type II toxin-antitoxin system prevent-host-death family antitoxin [Nevskia sp.]
MKASTPVNVHEAKTQFSKLLARVARGQDVIIAKAGKPIARLTPYTEPKRKIAPPGGMAGQGFWIADDFDAPVDELFDCLKDD